MFKNTYQNGLLSIFYSCGSNPLAIWEMEVQNGHIKRLTDSEVNSVVLEIVSTNVATTYISCPKRNQVLGIRLPFLVMIVKNLKRYFSFEITILDDKHMRRRFRISNFQSTTKIKPFCTSMPIGLSGGWNQIQFNLADFTRRAYGSQYIEAVRVQVHANVRLRRIYFSERLYTEEELPQDYKLYLPLEYKQQKKSKVAKREQQLPPPIPRKPASTVSSGKQTPGKSTEVAETVTTTIVTPEVTETGEEKSETTEAAKSAEAEPTESSLTPATIEEKGERVDDVTDGNVNVEQPHLDEPTTEEPPLDEPLGKEQPSDLSEPEITTEEVPAEVPADE